MNVTATLLLSLKQDIHFLNNLLDEISLVYEIGDLKSWLFPLKSHKCVSAIVRSHSFKTVPYEKCLEIALDRLYVLLNVFVHYLDEASTRNVLISEPKTPTLGLVLKLLWNSIIKLMDQKATKKTTSFSGNQIALTDKQCQTEIISLNTCDSCCSAILCMKRLLNSFDNHQDKIKVKYQIFDITQFGCMLKITSSIEEALQSLYSRLYREKADNEALKLENEGVVAKLKEKDSRIMFLEEEVQVLRQQQQKDVQDMVMLKQEKHTLTQDIISKEREIDFLKHTLENSNIYTQAILKENNTNKSQNKELKSNIEKSVEMLSIYRTRITSKFSTLDKEYDILKQITEQTEKSITCLNSKLTKILKHIGKLEVKLMKSSQSRNETFQEVTRYTTLCEKLKELYKKKLNESNEKTKLEAITIKGNPIEDIGKQIEENECKIENLEKENIKLKNLLSKFKNIKFRK